MRAAFAAVAALLALAAPATAAAPSWLNPFPAQSVWNAPLPAHPKVDPQNAARMRYFLAHSLVHPNMTLRAWGVAVAVATPVAPRYRIDRCTTGWPCTLSGAGAIPIPQGTKADPEGDGHLAVVDPAAGLEWDFWRASYTGGRWSAEGGAAVSTRGDGIAAAGVASGDAANFPLLGGLVRPEDFAAPEIRHALVFAMPGIAPGAPRCPATHNVATGSSRLSLPEGTRLQLDPSVDLSKLRLQPWERKLGRAMQRYGLLLRDNGGTFSIFAENPINRGYDAWSRAGFPAGDSIGFSDAFPWSRLRVLAAPSC
jgi:hypothetical protein